MIIGSITNYGSLQGSINGAGDSLSGVISDAGLMGGQVVGMRGLKGEKGVTGSTGASGQDGHSPVITSSKSGKTTTIKSDGETIATLLDGNDGNNGQDGHTPVIAGSKSGDTTTITADGVTIATINDGTNGTNGHSPVITTSKSGGTTTIMSDGTSIGTVLDGDDYVLTAQDKSDIAAIVLQDFPTWNGGNY